MRRLKLMNEVLPAPTRASSGGPRERTLRHMRRLLAFAATAAATPGCGTGYAVVDPLPAPPRCEGLAATLRATAVATSDGLIHVTLEAPTDKGTSYVNQAPADTKNFTITEGRAEFDVTPHAGKSTVRVQVDCPRGRASVQLTLDVPAGTLAEGTKIAVEIIDYY